ncbi:unnamed protein product [Adineta steineri]|uniref:Uncharacterized protein n=1 Tax=Adineta steineri TaxID=433720 RepID=A0A815P534_9BILA|nr:unnamed protein product [Adineta steineri]CAF1444369.1 unnamed protein product [Adineta steineri]CAF4109951.1 unnamed protein product [Adineta steineri]CAF4255487.1 unnamed protein product [Adineta steineri]
MVLTIFLFTVFVANVLTIFGQNNNVTTHVVVTNTTIVCPSTDIDTLYQANIELKETIIQMWNALNARLDILESRLSCLSNCSEPQVSNSTITPSILILEEKIYQNLTIDGNWRVLYDQPYSHATTSTNLLDAAKSCSNQVVVGARRNATIPQLELAAVGPVNVLQQETVRNTPVKYGDVYWYSTKAYSFGFTPNNTIFQYHADFFDLSSALCLSWHLDNSYGGYRAGLTIDLTKDEIWRKVIYCLD